MKSGQKRVLFVLHTTELNNGGIRSMVDLMEALIRVHGIYAVAVYPLARDSAIDYLEGLGVHCYHVPYRSWSYPLHARFSKKAKSFAKIGWGYLRSYWCMKRIEQIIREENLEVVYTNTSIMYIGAMVSKKLGLPHIWHVREFLKEDHEYGIFPGKRILYRKLSEADSVIYISKSVEEKYRCHISGDVDQRVIYDDISAVYVNPRKTFRMDVDDTLHILIAGILQNGKGQLEAIQAIEILKKKRRKVLLHIAGKMTGDYYQMLRGYVKQHHLEDVVVFDGFITDMNPYRSGMDVAIVASSHEAFGRVTVEGMLSMLAVIGADAAGTRELIQDKKTGLLYSLGNAEELAKKIDLLYQDRDFMRRLAEAGFHYAKDTFTTDRAAEAVVQLL